ncbi:MAG: S41 family peptidase [Candidatus Eisenbacteria bacterium]
MSRRHVGSGPLGVDGKTDRKPGRSADARKWLVSCATLAFCVATTAPLHAADPDGTVPGSEARVPAELVLDLESFDLVRKTIEARYPKPERIDSSWQSRADSLRSEVEASGSKGEARALLTALALSFGESHFAIIPSDAYGKLYEDEEDGADPGEASSSEGSVGLDVRWLDGALVAVRLDEGGSAERAGIVPGDEILSIDGRTTRDLVDVLRENADDSVSRFETSVAMVAQRRLTGKLGQERVIVLCRQPGDTLEVAAAIEPWRGAPTKLGALPEQTVETFSRDFGDAGVFGFSMFLSPMTVMPAAQSAFESFHDKKGIVIDLRGNFGGLLPMIQGIVGWLVSEPTQLGHMVMRDADLKLFANPRPPHFEGKVAILTDELSISAAELFTAGVQEAGLARVFGGRTAGLALPANVVRLPNGDGFMFVVAEYTTPKEVRLERTGVIPDVEVSFSRFDLYENADPVLDAALNWIRE